MSKNLNFLSKESKKEFLRLYGDDFSNWTVSTYAYNKATTNFDKIDDIIYDIIDAVFDCAWHNFNIDFDGVFGSQRENTRTYYINFYFEDIDFAYSSDGKSDTTEYGIKVMNEHFKFKNKCEIKQCSYDMLQICFTLKL